MIILIKGGKLCDIFVCLCGFDGDRHTHNNEILAYMKLPFVLAAKRHLLSLQK